jgi:predicted amidohydrolase YtcJ
MTASADLVLTGGEVRTLADPDEVAEAVAVRDGRIVRVGSAYEVGFLEGVATRVIDLAGGVLLPGFVDAHTHLELVGRRQRHLDLAGADSRGEAIERLRERSEDGGDEWVQGYGYDESAWADDHRLRREDLDRVETDRPVVAFREDLHTASLSSTGLERLRESMPESDVLREDGRATGVVVEDAIDGVFAATAPDAAGYRDLVAAAREAAHRRGVTAVHEMVRNSAAPRAYRDLALAGELDLRVRLNYWHDHLDALLELGAATNHGGSLVRVGGVKSYTDGSFGAGTAKLREPYETGGTGRWVLAPRKLRRTVERVAGADLQMVTHAIGDAAIEATLDAYADHAAPGDRHRIEHAELMPDDLLERAVTLADDDRIVLSMQPNFHRWARAGGLYERLLGDRTRLTSRLGDLADAGVDLAFGSDCMPMDPLYGVQQAVTAPAPGQRVDVTTALRAYTRGAARAGFDESRLGTLEPGTAADLVALSASPWDVDDDAIADVDVALTVVGGRVVHDARSVGSDGSR